MYKWNQISWPYQNILRDFHQLSLEVLLPFLYYLNPNISIVPLCVASHDLYECREVGEAIASVVKGKDALIVTSSDMTHYEPHEAAKAKDKKAIDAITVLNEEKVAQVVLTEQISMCGFLPAYVMIVAAKCLGAESARLVDYRTSGDALGDYPQVVGYAGMVIQ